MYTLAFLTMHAVLVAGHIRAMSPPQLDRGKCSSYVFKLDDFPAIRWFTPYSFWALQLAQLVQHALPVHQCTVVPSKTDICWGAGRGGLAKFSWRVSTRPVTTCKNNLRGCKTHSSLACYSTAHNSSLSSGKSCAQRELGSILDREILMPTRFS